MHRAQLLDRARVICLRYPFILQSVLINRQTIGRHWAWIVFVALATAAATAWYIQHANASGRLPGGASLPGLAFGIAAATIMVFELLLWPRKLLRRWRLGSAKSWLRAHIWLGLLTVPLVLLHSGFHWGGTLSTTLAALFILVIASGIFGLAMQQWLPRLMLSDLPAETIASQIEHVSETLRMQAAARVAALCGEESPQAESYEPLARAFASEIGPFLSDGRGTAVADAAGASAYFTGLRNALDPSAGATVDLLEDYCDQRRQFQRQLRLHRWLHGWLLIHLPLSIILIVLMFVHAYLALKFR
jgi:hypothetical protein